MSSTDVNVPEPTEEEVALQQEQLELLRFNREALEEQQRLEQLLLPILLEDADLEAVRDETGRIIEFQERELTPEEQEREDREQQLEDTRLGLEQQFLDRQAQALAGELEIDPALTRRLEEEEQSLRDTLLRQLGTGFETSTPGIEALGDFEQRKQEILTAASRGELTTSAALAEATGRFREGALAQDFQQGLQNFGLRTGTVSAPFSTTGQIFQLAQGFGAAQQPFQFQRQSQFQASAAEAAGNAQIIGGLGQAAGTIGATFLLSSDCRLKKAVKKVTGYKGLTVYRWKWKDPKRGSGMFVGFIAQEVRQKYPQFVGTMADGYLGIDYKGLLRELSHAQ